MKKIIYLLVVVLIYSCGSSDGPGDNVPNENPVLTSITISSSNGNQLDLFGTNTTTLNATGKDQTGKTIGITGTLNWSSNNGIVSVDNNGLATGQEVGNSIVTASAGSISAIFVLSVVDTEPQSGTFVYVSDAAQFATGPWKIVRYDENGQNAMTFIDDDLAWPQDILFLEDQGQVLISNLSSNKINRYDASTGNLIGSFAAGISGPTRMKIGADNLLYVLQWEGNGLVRRYQLDGTFVDQFTNVGVTRSIGLDWDSMGNLYVSSFDGASVRKFDSNGNDLGLFVTSGLQGPTNIWFDENDNLFVNDWTGNKVIQFDSDGNLVGDFISSGLSQPEGVDFFPNGDFLIGSGGTAQMRMYDSNGVFLKNLVSAGAGGLVRPNAVRIREIQ
ncbi:hypothetical protein [Flagellimonas sp. S3867]|uniref:hypothetical protein n=1 Tax=Flagellimonas sp. S3867 TaxID=2768063 RepID=UPI001682DB22|nr:hypothetical protein [Flagellimonas sp. S3867]